MLCWEPAATAHGSWWASCATAALIAAGVMPPPWRWRWRWEVLPRQSGRFGLRFRGLLTCAFHWHHSTYAPLTPRDSHIGSWPQAA
eukprot:5162303-Pyramimonas_sp.AAC.1